MVIFHSYVTVYQRVTLMLVDDDMSINHHFFWKVDLVVAKPWLVGYLII